MTHRWKTVLGLATLAATVWGSTALRAAELTDDDEVSERQLIVLLAAGAQAPTPEAVVAAAAERKELPAGLSVGSPESVSYAIRRRATGVARQLLRQEPESLGARLERYIVLTYPRGTDLWEVRKALLKNPGVDQVEKNSRATLAVVPVDPLFSPQVSPPYPFAYQWGSGELNLPLAWDATPGHAYVGVIDTGLATNHEDLRAFTGQGGSLVYQGGHFRPQMSYDYGYNDADVDEAQPQLVSGVLQAVQRAGHGTHVSGIIAATANNGLGVAGACWNCSLLMAKGSQLRKIFIEGSFQYSNDAGLSEDIIAAALMGLTNSGAQVISMSFGRRPPVPNCAVTGLYCDALQYAHEHDVILVAAAGNGGATPVDFPASDPRVIAVGGTIPGKTFWDTCDPATDTADCPSNYGSDQELAAPARQILSTFYPGLPYAGTGCDDRFGEGGPGYGPCTGTSMSSPYVAASAAMVRSVNPLLSEANVRDLLAANASNGGIRNSQTGYGVPDVSRSVRKALGLAAGNTLVNRLTPLFSFYHATAEDFYYTTVPQMATAALHDSYFPAGQTVPGYPQFPGDRGCQVGPCIPTDPRAAVYLFTTPQAPASGLPPLVPLYRMSFRGPNPATGNPANRDTTYTTDVNGIKAFKNTGYELDGIEGYIFQPCTPVDCAPPGTVRLFRRYNPQRDDFAIFPESELAAMQSQGYTSTGGGNEVIGYVYPNLDTDSDTLIDGFETLLGTNPAKADTDLDGLTDGAEVLHYPYSDPLQFPKAVQFVAQSVPATMVAGQSYSVSLTVKNIGTLNWSPVGPVCNAYRLGSSNPQDNLNWGRSRADLTASLNAGQQVAVPFTVTAPATPGTYNFQWRMVHECVEWFGVTSPNVMVNVQNVPPVARFTFSCSGLACSFNGSTSTDNVGIVSYAWSFGATGAFANQTFGAPGSYPVTLTVTDAQGLQSTLTKTVSVISDPPPAAESFFSINRCRLVDTRSSTPLNGNQVYVFNITGNCGIPATAKAVSVNVGIANATQPGFAVFYPGNQTSSLFINASLNFTADPSPRFNNAILRLATNGTGTLAVQLAIGGSAPSANFILDLDGYFSEDTSPTAGTLGPLGYQTLVPCRLADTRITASPLTHGVPRSFSVQSQCGVPAGAVVGALNLAAVSPSEVGLIQLFQAGTPVPSLATVRFPAGTSAQANGARVRLATTVPDVAAEFDGASTSAGTSHLVIDTYGYFKADAPLKYRPLTSACRLVDTRVSSQGSPALAGGSTRAFQVQGNCGVPVGAKAAFVNATAVTPSGPGFLTLYASGTPFPAASMLNFDQLNQSGAIGNGVIVPLSTLADDLAVTCGGSGTHLVLDVYGYFQ